MKNLRFSLYFLVLLTCYSCKQLTGGYTGANDILDDYLLGGLSYLQVGPQKHLLEGNMAVKSSHSFRMKFKLSNGKSSRFIFYANKKLENGLSANFKRVNQNIIVSFKLNGVIHTSDLGTFSEEVDLLLDVHNDHGDTHFILWNTRGPFGDNEGCVQSKKCLYNTESFTFPNDGPWGSQGRGSGNFWGSEGTKSNILLLEGPSKAITNV